VCCIVYAVCCIVYTFTAEYKSVPLYHVITMKFLVSQKVELSRVVELLLDFVLYSARTGSIWPRIGTGGGYL
jgi:hypothetical protein